MITDASRQAVRDAVAMVQGDNRGPELDPAALHGLAGVIVRRLAPETEAHPAALLSGFLAMFGNAVGAGPHVRIGGDTHGARLNVCNVGTTARARKGTAGSLVREVMLLADPGWAPRVVGGFGSGESVVDAVRDATEDDPGPGDHRLMIREPEFCRVLQVAEREGSTLSMIGREAWDGTNLAVRSRNKTVAATGAHISVLADVTLEELRKTLSSTQVANGFANRYLFLLVHRSQKLPSGGNLDDDDFAYCADLTAQALREARHIGRMQRTQRAVDVWSDIYHSIPDDERGLFGSIVARAEAHLLRLSVVYALLDGSREIDVDHLRAASAVWDYSRASALTIFGEATGNPDADRLYAALVEAGEDGLDGEQQHAVFSGHITKTKLEDARLILEGKGLATTVQQATRGRPRTRTFLAEKAEQAREVRLLDLPSLLSHPHPAEVMP